MTTALFSGTEPLLLFLAKATLVLILAIGASVLLRRSSAGERHLVWLAALVGVLALPLLSRIPALQLGILPSGLAPASFATMTAPLVLNSDGTPVDLDTLTPSPQAPGTRIMIMPPTTAAAAASAVTIIGMPTEQVTMPPIARSSFAGFSTSNASGSILRMVAIVWAGVALSLLAWLAFAALQVRRILARATELTSPDWTMPLCEVADRLDLEQPPRLVMTDRIEMAFACRVLAPTIVLPAAAESWSDDRRRAVLFHELAHVKRHDLVSHTLGRIACALYWFHPLVWTAARNLRNESEKACDDLVLSCGARASDYAQHLLDMVTSVRNHGAPALGIPMARRKEFEGRMLAILDPAIRRASRGRGRAATVIAGVTALSLTIAAVSPARSSAAPALASEVTVLPDTMHPSATAETIVAVAPRGAAAEAMAGAEQPAVDAEASSSASSAIAASAPLPAAAASGNDGDKLGRALGLVATSAAKEVLSGLGLRLGLGTYQTGAAAADTGRVALLIKVLATDSDAQVRRAAAWGLSDVGSAAARAALAKALQSDIDTEVREMSAWSLAEHNGEESAAALGNALLHDKSVKVRQTAAWALGQAGRRADADALVSALSDNDPQVRETSIWALGQVDLNRAPATLLNALGDNSPRVREITAWTLGQIGDSIAVRPLVRAFESESDAKLKEMYLWSLSQIGTAPTDVIESAMKSSDPELRRHAVTLLTGSGGSWPMPMPRPMPRPNP